MRPTDLQFRPIREKTPEPNRAQITRDSSPLFTQIQERSDFVRKKSCDMQRQSHMGFGFQDHRFSNDYTNHFRDPTSKSIAHLGPGTYEGDTQFKKLASQACAVKYQHLSIGQKLAASGDYHFENGRLIYEPSYKDPRKKMGAQYFNYMGKNSNTSLNQTLVTQEAINQYTNQLLQSQQDNDIQSRNSQQKMTNSVPMSQAFLKQISHYPSEQANVMFTKLNTSGSFSRKKRSKTPINNFTAGSSSNKTFNRSKSKIGNGSTAIQTSYNPSNVIIFMGNTINMNPQNTYFIQQPEAKLTNERTSISPLRYQNVVDNNAKNKQSSKSFYNPSLTQNLTSQQRSRKNQAGIYRIIASDSNVKSGYFKHGFQCPTQSSTQQRTKPIAYDIEIAKDNFERLTKRPTSGIRINKKVKRMLNNIQNANSDLMTSGSQNGVINIQLKQELESFDESKGKQLRQQWRYGGNIEDSQKFLEVPSNQIGNSGQIKQSQNFSEDEYRIFDDVKVFNQRSSAQQNSSMHPNKATETQQEVSYTQKFNSITSQQRNSEIQESKSIRSEAIPDQTQFSSINFKNNDDSKSEVGFNEQVLIKNQRQQQQQQLQQQSKHPSSQVQSSKEFKSNKFEQHEEHEQ